MKSIKEEKKGSEAKANALGLLQNLAVNDENKPKLFATPGLVKEAMKSIKQEEKGSRVKANAFELLSSLAANDNNKPKLFAAPGLVEGTIKSIKEEETGSEVKGNAFGLLWSLAMNDENMPKLFATPGLVEEAIKSIKDEAKGSEVKAEVLGLLSNLALDEGNRPKLFAAPGLIEGAMKSIKDEEKGSEVKGNALGLLWNLSFSDAVVVPLFETPGFPELLIEMLEFEALGARNFQRALAITGNLSFSSPLRSKWLAMKADDIIARRVLVTTGEEYRETRAYHETRVGAVMTLAVMYFDDEEKSKRLHADDLVLHPMMEELLQELEGSHSSDPLRRLLVPLATLSRVPSNRRRLEEKESLLSILIDKALPRFLLSNPLLVGVTLSILSQYALDENKTYFRRLQSDEKLGNALSKVQEKCLSSPFEWASIFPQLESLLRMLVERNEKSAS